MGFLFLTRSQNVLIRGGEKIFRQARDGKGTFNGWGDSSWGLVSFHDGDLGVGRSPFAAPCQIPPGVQPCPYCGRSRARSIIVSKITVFARLLAG